MAEDRRRHIEEYYLTEWKFVTKKKVEKCIYIMTKKKAEKCIYILMLVQYSLPAADIYSFLGEL